MVKRKASSTEAWNADGAIPMDPPQPGSQTSVFAPGSFGLPGLLRIGV
jgi:hypothetical protein